MPAVLRLAPVLLALLAGCDASPPRPPPPGDAEGATEGDTEPGPSGGPAAEALPAMRWDVRPEGPEWTRLAFAAVEGPGAGLLAVVPGDVAAWCPGYAQAGAEARAAFWVGLMSALAQHESNYRPEVSFEESFVDSTGRRVVSRGLLQISEESARGYGCAFGAAEELHDPAVNLDWGARILARWVPRDGVVSSAGGAPRGAARYWSPFRRDDDRADMAAWTAGQPFCAP